MPPPQSKAWSYFKRDVESKIVKCKLCNLEMTYTGGTSNMLNHLKLKHSSDISGWFTPEKQPSVAEFANSPRSRKLSSSQNEHITRAIVEMVVLDYMPLKLVEGKGFLNLMSILAPDYKVPSRNTVKSRIEMMYCDRKEKFISDLKEVETVSLTTDTWTSNATKSFITVTEHHINESWNLQSNVLLTREMPERHTGENLVNKLKSAVSECNLDGKVSTVVHDNARNINSAGVKCPEWDDLNCFGHTIQLCIKPSLEIPAVSKLIARARKLVGHFKHSTTVMAEMRKRQKLFELPQHELIQDVATRWNSSQMMLERLCEQRRVVTDVMLDTKMTKKNDVHMLLKDHEWDTMSEVSCVLKQLSNVTTYMCLEKDVSSSVMYPIVCGLLKKHLTTVEGESPLIRKMMESIANELKTRYNPFDKEIASSQPVIASLLDPRYKSLSFFSDEQKKLAWETLETKLDDIPLHPFKKQNVNDEEIAPKKPKVQRSLDFLLCDEPDEPYMR